MHRIIATACGSLRAIEHVPTPTVSGMTTGRNGKYQQGGESITAYVRRVPTPTASDERRGKSVRGRNAQGGPSLGEMLGGKANPQYVEWLMGWPTSWTEAQPWGTGRSPLYTRWLSAFCTSG